MPRPFTVLYGFIPSHERRNVATPDWKRVLESHSHRGHVLLPHADLTPQGELVRFPPRDYDLWPGTRRLAFVHLAQLALEERLAARRAARAPEVTERLVRAMDRLVEGAGGEFAVLLLTARDAAQRDVKGGYLAAFERHDVEVLDCALGLTRELRIPGDPHPNERANAAWARCVGERPAGRLPVTPEPSA